MLLDHEFITKRKVKRAFAFKWDVIPVMNKWYAEGRVVRDPHDGERRVVDVVHFPIKIVREPCPLN